MHNRMVAFPRLAVLVVFAGWLCSVAHGEEADGGANGTSVDEEMESLGSIIDDIKSQVFGAQKGAAPQSFSENVMAFYSAVDWSERWIQAILVWHGMCWLTFLVFRRNANVQTGLFFGVAFCVAAAERLNTLGRTHWERFATQDYFDEHGVFAGAIFCAPLLALSLAMLVNFVVIAANLLVDVKRRELKDHRDAEAKAKEQEATAIAPKPEKVNNKKKTKKAVKGD